MKLFLTSLDFLPFSISILLHSVVAGESALSWSPLSWTPSSQVAVPPVPHIELHSQSTTSKFKSFRTSESTHLIQSKGRHVSEPDNCFAKHVQWTLSTQITVRDCLLKRDRGCYHRAPKDQCCPRVELQHFPIKTFSEKDGGNHRPTDTGCKRTKRQANVWHQQVHVSGSNGKIILYSDLNACQVHPAPLRPLLRREAAQQVHGGQGKVGGAGELSSRER